MSAAPTDDAPVPAGVVPRLSGVFVLREDVAADRAVYESLGWRSKRTDHLFVPFALGDSAISLWDREVAGEHLVHAAAAGIECHGVVLGIVLESAEDVDAAVEVARRAGATVITAPTSTAFGRSGLVADPSGTWWELCWIDGVTVDDPWTKGLAVEAACRAELTAVTIATEDPDGLRRFYEDLGWACGSAQGARDARFELAGTTLVVRPAQDVRAEVLDAGFVDPLPMGGVSATLEVVADDVDDAVATLAELGAEVARRATVRADGSVVGWLTDPNGVRWELQRSIG